MRDGSYKFVLVDGAWDLRKTSFDVTIDNSNCGSDFNYVSGNEQGLIKSGKIESIHSSYRFDIVFDRGDGGEPREAVVLRDLPGGC